MTSKNLFTALLLGAAAFTSASFAAEISPATVPISRDTSVKWIANGYTKAAAELAERDLSKVDIVFIGDSITARWRAADGGGALWSEAFPNALNLGMGGDRTEHVLYRLMDKADGGLGQLSAPELRPGIIVLMIGTNNLFQHTAEQIIPGIAAVKERLAELKPDARIILCSMLPTHKLDFNSGVILPVNAAIQKLPGIEWLDLYSDYLDESGELREPKLFKDGLHPNPDGYKIWHKRLQEHLAVPKP